MIYQLLPESPKSGPNPNPHCRYVGYKYVLCLVIASFVLCGLFVAPTGRIGDITRNGFINIARKETARDVSSDPIIYKTDIGHESNHAWEQELEPVEKIVLLGERHSGTNWITYHLQDCFSHGIQVTPHYSRFKHWFQKEDLYRGATNSAVVVSMFRDPYDWVWAMKERPHHAHDHIGLPWLEFVTKPWIGHRGPRDRNITLVPGMKENVTCFSQFSFVEVMPCSRDDSPKRAGYADYKYELFVDGSERAYSSIIDLRRAKIVNHLSVAQFSGTKAFYPFRYEDLESNGTELLLSLLERATGVERKCNATEPGREVRHKEVPKDYVEWMNKYGHWDVEAQIGYHRR
eukprot:CCRYP_001902-RC/>CCRYP_001902-RC protein AED:0.33 eAED:0.33 QI:0/1/0/1/1/1/2/0/345